MVHEAGDSNVTHISVEEDDGLAPETSSGPHMRKMNTRDALPRRPRSRRRQRHTHLRGVKRRPRARDQQRSAHARVRYRMKKRVGAVLRGIGHGASIARAHRRTVVSEHGDSCSPGPPTIHRSSISLMPNPDKIGGFEGSRPDFYPDIQAKRLLP